MKPRKLPALPNGLTFNVIDVETANSNQATICQIGIVSVVDGSVRDEWATLVDPEDSFSGYLTGKIHGIAEEHILDAPTLPSVWSAMREIVEDQVLISHTHFDRTALDKAADRYYLNKLRVDWRDSLIIARDAWPTMPGKHGLKNLAARLDIQLRHHDALEDAWAAAVVVLKAYGQS